jgi:hypothetical protein
LDIILIEWAPPSSDGGSPILGYSVEMIKTSEGVWRQVYNGTENPSTKRLAITKYNNASLEVTGYKIRITAYNWVGSTATSGGGMEIVIPTSDSAALSQL